MTVRTVPAIRVSSSDRHSSFVIRHSDHGGLQRQGLWLSRTRLPRVLGHRIRISRNSVPVKTTANFAVSRAYISSNVFSGFPLLRKDHFGNQGGFLLSR